MHDRDKSNDLQEGERVRQKARKCQNLVDGLS